MPTGKKIATKNNMTNLKQALKDSKLDEFIQEHSVKGDEDQLDQILGDMIKTPLSTDQTSDPILPDDD
jgi:hypothetical protein